MLQPAQNQPSGTQMPSSATSVTQTDKDIKRMEAGAPSSSSVSTVVADANVEQKEEEAAGANTLGELEKKETLMSIRSPAAFPDGGFQAWACTFGAFCCLFCSFGWINVIGIFQGYYQQNQLKEYSPSTVSWVGSLEIFCMFSGGAVVGKFYDAYGPRYIVLLGTFLHVFGIMMASISTEFYQLALSQGICSAIGASLIFYGAMSSVSTWFYKRRAFALGITASGSSLGGVIFPIMIRRLIVTVGFGWSMRITAFLILFMMVFANLTVRSRLPPKGMTPWVLSEFISPFKELPYASIVVGGFLFFFGMFLPFNYLPVYAQRNGMSDDLSNYLVAILNASSIFGRIIPGYIGDKMGRFNMMVLITYASGILVFALWIPGTGNIPTIIFAALYGFTTGAFVSLIPALAAQISDIREIGVRNGAMFAVVSVAALTGNPIGGALVSTYDGGYLELQIFAGAVIMAGSTAFLTARWSLSGWKIRAKV